MPDTPIEHQRTIHNDCKQIQPIIEEMIAGVQQCSFSERDQFAIRLCAEEALTNAIKHGNQACDDKTVVINWKMTTDQIVMTVVDEGCGFSPEDVPDPTLDENIAKPHGRGLMLIKSYMSQVTFNDRGNAMTMVLDRH